MLDIQESANFDKSKGVSTLPIACAHHSFSKYFCKLGLRGNSFPKQSLYFATGKNMPPEGSNPSTMM